MKIFALVAGLCLLSGCFWGFQKNTYEKFNIPETSGKEVFDGDPEPHRPPYKESLEGIWGIDSDNDDIRDDLEIYINRNFEHRRERENLKLYFRHMKKTILAAQKVRDQESLNQLMSLRDRGELIIFTCLFNSFLVFGTEMRIFSKKRNKTFEVFKNTYERDVAFRLPMIKDPRTVFDPLPPPEVLIEFIKANCKFNLKEIEIIKKYYNGG